MHKFSASIVLVKKREAFVEAVSPSDRALARTTGHAASA